MTVTSQLTNFLHFLSLYCATDVVIGFDPVSYNFAEESGRAEVIVRILNGTLANNAVVLLNTSSSTAQSM